MRWYLLLTKIDDSKMKKINIVYCLLLLLVIAQCGKDSEENENSINIPEGNGFDNLSEYNFFEGELHDLIPNSEAGVLPYDLNMPLFSDYALKKRFVYVPEGVVTPFDTSNVLSFPTGSVLIKHFYYNENGVDNYIETRLLIKKSSGWQAETYEWNEAQTDAVRKVAGATKVLTTTVNGQTETFNYLIPNLNQCQNCHNYNGSLEAIGPSIHNLNKSYDYEDGTENQLDKWISEGILASTSMSNIPKFAQMDDANASLNDKARAYLAVNCSSCHRLAGSAANSGLYLEYDNHDSLSLGFYKTPVAAGAGSGGLTYVIQPGDASQSILHYRMNTSQVDARMPEIGRELIHAEGVQLIEDWINAQ